VSPICLFGINTENLANCGDFFPLIGFNYIACSPVLLVHSFSTYLHSLFLEDPILVDIWKASLLTFNYILYFCGSLLHFLQLSNMVTTPYLALDFNRSIIRNWYNFSIIVSGD